MCWVDSLTCFYLQCLILLQTLPAGCVPCWLFGPWTPPTPYLITYISVFSSAVRNHNLRLLHLAHGDFQWNLGIKALFPHQASFLVSPSSTPHPLPLVRVDRYFPCSLSLMWNWLFVQTLLCLHKDLDRTASNAPHITSWTCSSGHTTGLLTVWKDSERNIHWCEREGSESRE